jgi:hypothetical protein
MATIGLGAFLLSCAVGLMVWQTMSWRSAYPDAHDDAERDYLRRRHRRRMQTGVLMALVALAVPAADWVISETLSPRLGTAIIGVILALIAWIVVMTAADLGATKLYYGRVRDSYQLEQMRLQAELRRLQNEQAAGGNGRQQSAPDDRE